MEMLARSVAAFRVATRLASAPTIRCRSACLIEVRSNFRLPIVPTNTASEAMPHPASSLPPSKRHSRLTTVRRGCDLSRIAEIHGEAMYTALTLRSACSHSSYKLPMPGVEGPSPRLSLGGFKGGILFGKRIPPLVPRAHASPPPALARENQAPPLEKGVKKTRHICGRSFSELISNNACCGSYGRPRSSCGA